MPGRRRPAVGAASLQPHVQDVHGPGRGGRRGRLPATRDRAGHLRQLQERPAVEPQEAALRHRPDRQVLPQRDQPRQLRLPDARVRADGDAVLRRSRTTCGAAFEEWLPRASGLVRALRRDAGAAALPRARARRAGPLRQEGDRHRVPLPVRLEGARGHPQPRRLRPRQPCQEQSGENLEYFDPATEEHSSRGSSRPPAAPTARRSRSSSTRIARKRCAARRASSCALHPRARAVQGGGAAAAQEAARDRRALPPDQGRPASAT